MDSADSEKVQRGVVSGEEDGKGVLLLQQHKEPFYQQRELIIDAKSIWGVGWIRI